MKKKFISCCILVAMAPNLILGTPASATVNNHDSITRSENTDNNSSVSLPIITEYSYGNQLEFDEDLYYGNNIEARAVTKNYYKRNVKINWSTLIDILCKVLDTASNIVSRFIDSDTKVTTNPSNNLVGYNYQTIGGNVQEVQKLLNQHGYALAEDGIWGPKTYSAVVNFQKSQGLVADGIVGYNTWNALHGK